MNESTEPLGIIFDFDGVLVDSFVHNAQHIRHIFTAYNIDVSVDDLWHYRGHSLPQIVATFSQQHGIQLPYDAVERAVNDRQDASRHALAEQGLPPGLTEFLDQAKAAGALVAIGSSNVPANIHGFLRAAGINDAFTVFVTAQDTDRHKPDPTPFLIAAERLGVTPTRCVVIEDAETGIEAAHRAGMLAIGYTGFLRSSTEPLLPHADVRIASFAELSVERLRALVNQN